ncbi:Crustacean hyperglycemic hormone, partial [Armadillidium nasatum]
FTALTILNSYISGINIPSLNSCIKRVVLCIFGKQQIINTKMPISSVAVCLVIFLSLAEIFECRGVDNLALEDFGSIGMKAKRRSSDSSCKGIYDREIFDRLERVCDDCYNLFRNSQTEFLHNRSIRKLPQRPYDERLYQRI